MRSIGITAHSVGITAVRVGRTLVYIYKNVMRESLYIIIMNKLIHVEFVVICTPVVSGSNIHLSVLHYCILCRFCRYCCFCCRCCYCCCYCCLGNKAVRVNFGGPTNYKITRPCKNCTLPVMFVVVVVVVVVLSQSLTIIRQCLLSLRQIIVLG